MTSFTRFTARASKGFTLMELMVVMAIIAVLIGILVPVSSSAMREMRKVQAQKTCSDLRSAIMMFQTEYKRFPAVNGVHPGTDSVIETDANTGLISVLVAMPNNALVEQVNRRGIAYFSDKAARSEDKPGVYRKDNNAQLKDPWGNFYRVIMDTDYNNQIEVETGEGANRVIYNVLAVHSFGPNKKIGGGGQRDDDIFAE